MDFLNIGHTIFFFYNLISPMHESQFYLAVNFQALLISNITLLFSNIYSFCSITMTKIVVNGGLFVSKISFLRLISPS